MMIRRKIIEQAGVQLTQLFNELKALYLKVKDLDETADCTAYQETLSQIESRYYPICISKQILFSNWYAHYKFYWEHQIGWVNEQLKFSLLRDKIPLSLSIYVVILIAVTSIWFFDLINYICKMVNP